MRMRLRRGWKRTPCHLRTDRPQPCHLLEKRETVSAIWRKDVCNFIISRAFPDTTWDSNRRALARHLIRVLYSMLKKSKPCHRPVNPNLEPTNLSLLGRSASLCPDFQATFKWSKKVKLDKGLKELGPTAQDESAPFDPPFGCLRG